MTSKPKVESKKVVYVELETDNLRKVELKDETSIKNFCDTCGKYCYQGLKKGICWRCWQIIDTYAYREMVFTQIIHPPSGKHPT